MSRAAELKKIIDDAYAELAGIAPIDRMGVRELARQAGISPTTATRVKRGETPDMATAKKLLPFLNDCPCCGRKLREE